MCRARSVGCSAWLGVAGRIGLGIGALASTSGFASIAPTRAIDIHHVNDDASTQTLRANRVACLRVDVEPTIRVEPELLRKRNICALSQQPEEKP